MTTGDMDARDTRSGGESGLRAARTEPTFDPARGDGSGATPASIPSDNGSTSANGHGGAREFAEAMRAAANRAAQATTEAATTAAERVTGSAGSARPAHQSQRSSAAAPGSATAPATPTASLTPSVPPAAPTGAHVGSRTTAPEAPGDLQRRVPVPVPPAAATLDEYSRPGAPPPPPSTAPSVAATFIASSSPGPAPDGPSTPPTPGGAHSPYAPGASTPAAAAVAGAAAARGAATPAHAPARPAPPPFEGSADPGRTHVAPAPRTQSPVDAARAATAGPATGAATRSTTGPAQRHQARIRKARLRLLRVDPWSVMKTSFLLSIAAGAMLVVAVGVLWSVLDAAGVFSGVGDVVRDVTSSESSPGFSVEEYLGFSRVLGFSTLIAVIDVVLITALATLGAFLYNLSASLLGGLEVTLAEDD